MRRTGIYRIRNKATGLVYIGSALNMQFRIEKHFDELQRGCHHNSHLQRDFNLIGEGGFDWAPLALCGDDELRRVEGELIRALPPAAIYNRSFKWQGDEFGELKREALAKIPIVRRT